MSRPPTTVSRVFLKGIRMAVRGSLGRGWVLGFVGKLDSTCAVPEVKAPIRGHCETKPLYYVGNRPVSWIHEERLHATLRLVGRGPCVHRSSCVCPGTGAQAAGDR